MSHVSSLLSRIRCFHKPNPLYPLSTVWPPGRRSAVLVLLFIGQRGELRVLLTKRSRKLRNFAGHVSFPGGKADNDIESAEKIARREAEEEIGLPQDPTVLRELYSLSIETLSLEIPHYLSRTLLSVKPIVCFLHNANEKANIYSDPLNINHFFGKLNPGETSSIFSIPLLDLLENDIGTLKHKEYVSVRQNLLSWGGLNWAIKHYHYPIENPADMPCFNHMANLSSDEDSENILRNKTRDVWGLTAKIIHNVACIASRILSSEELTSIGHEELINALYNHGGQLRDHSRSEWERRLINAEENTNFADILPKDIQDHLRNQIF